MKVEAIQRRSIGKCQQIAALVSKRTDNKGDGIHPTAIAPLELMRIILFTDKLILYLLTLLLRNPWTSSTSKLSTQFAK